MHAHEMRAHDIHARGMHAYEARAIMHAHEVHTPMKVFARQNTAAPLFQLQLGFLRCRIWVSVIVVVS
jgi:hypothetical protein